MYALGPFEFSFHRSEKKIVCRETIKLGEHELVLITGPSGGGKSTLLQILKGIIPEYRPGVLSGEVSFKGEALHGEPFKKNLKDILFLFQNPFSQLLYQNASEEFLFSMENFGFTREEMDRRKADFEDYFQLTSLWEKKTTNLSNGECQKLVLASLLAVNPSVLLLDEPTAFLDPKSRKEFYDWLSTIKGHRLIVMIDHHVDEILPIADRVLIVDERGEVSERKERESVLHASEKVWTWPDLRPVDKRLSLRLNHVYFHYPEQSELLKDLNLNASNGDIVVIKGRNGKGKSTLFKLMAGLLKPLEGEVEFSLNGSLLSPKKLLKHIGFVFQNPETHFFYDTIADELRFLPERDRDHLISVFLSEINRERSPFLLSEGEKRRLSLLMTVYQDRDILFYDEPTFGQDRENILMIRSMIQHQQQLGKIQFIISHDESFMTSLHPVVYELENFTLKRT